MSSEDETDLPEAPPRSDLEEDIELEVQGGTLVWEDPEASGNPVTMAYALPAGILFLIALALLFALI